MAVPTACESRWDDIRASFERHRDELAKNYPEAVDEIGLIHTALIMFGQLIRASAPFIGNGAAWQRLTAQAESERAVLCKHMDGKSMLTAMRRLYSATFREMTENAAVEPAQPTESPEEEFREQRRRKGIPSDDHAQALRAKKSSIAPPLQTPQTQTRN
jgi:hypothetical protein